VGELLDYDWTTTSITVRGAPSVITRSGHFDNWARQFLAMHPCAVVQTWGAGWTAGSSDTFTDVSWPYRVMAKVMSLHPAMRYMAQYHRYAF
jgi:hypothetical protein